MKVYVVANLKGGVGKTTTTVNVAYTFSEMGGRVLVLTWIHNVTVQDFLQR